MQLVSYFRISCRAKENNSSERDQKRVINGDCSRRGSWAILLQETEAAARNQPATLEQNTKKLKVLVTTPTFNQRPLISADAAPHELLCPGYVSVIIIAVMIASYVLII